MNIQLVGRGSCRHTDNIGCFLDNDGSFKQKFHGAGRVFVSSELEADRRPFPPSPLLSLAISFEILTSLPLSIILSVQSSTPCLSVILVTSHIFETLFIPQYRIQILSCIHHQTSPDLSSDRNNGQNPSTT